MKKLLMIGFFVVTSSAFAERIEVPTFLEGTWLESSESGRPDKIEIGSNLSISYEMARQVGRKGTEIPYPTVCYYRQTGVIETVKTTQAAQGESYSLDYKVSKVELIPSKKNSDHCADFVKRENTEATGEGLEYSWSASKANDNQISGDNKTYNRKVVKVGTSTPPEKAVSSSTHKDTPAAAGGLTKPAFGTAAE